jgi:hypothetical protein
MNVAMKRAALESAKESAAEAENERAAQIAAQAAVKAANESSIMALKAAARARVAAAVASEAVKSAQAAEAEHQKLGKVFLIMGAAVKGGTVNAIASAIATDTGIPVEHIKASVSKTAATVVEVELPQNGAHSLAQKVQAGAITSIAKVPVVAASTTSGLQSDTKGIATSQIMSVLHKLQASVAQLQQHMGSANPPASVPTESSSSISAADLHKSSTTSATDLHNHIVNQIAEVRKAMSMELITHKAGQQIIDVLTKALAPQSATATAATVTTAATTAATVTTAATTAATANTSSAVNSNSQPKIVVDAAAKSDIQKRLRSLLKNISALKDSFAN